MIKIRLAWMSNFKLLLIFLVVAGHCMEQMGLAGSAAYRLIYLFHMPAFAFLSGMGMKSREKCLQSAGQAAVIYIFAQGTAVLYGLLSGKKISFLTPYWHLWYLLSLSFWSVLLWVYHTVKRRDSHEKYIKVIWFISAAAAAAVCGALPAGRFLSLSRTVVFFPYILLGKYFSEKYPCGVSGKQRIQLGAAGFFGLYFAGQVLKRPGYVWLYRADSFKILHFQVTDGILLRIQCFFAVLSLLLIAMSCVSPKRLAVTQIGNDTLPVYLLHVIPVGACSFIHQSSIAMAFLAAAAVTGGIWLLVKWFRPLYGVRI